MNSYYLILNMSYESGLLDHKIYLVCTDEECALCKGFLIFSLVSLNGVQKVPNEYAVIA